MENAGEAQPRCTDSHLRFFAAKYVRFLLSIGKIDLALFCIFVFLRFCIFAFCKCETASVRQLNKFHCAHLLAALCFTLAFGHWLLAHCIVMLKFAAKREQSQACLGYAEREQIEQS